MGKLSTSLNLSSYLVSNGSKSLSISGGDSSCSWVLVCALGLIVKEEFKSVLLGRGWKCGELLVSSSTFTVIQRICKSVPPQKHPHWKNTNIQLQYSLYCYSWDWWWQVNAESTVNARSSHSKCSRNPSSLVSTLLQLLPWLALRAYTLGAGKGCSLNTWNDSATQGAHIGKMITLGKDLETWNTGSTWQDTAKKLCNTRTFINTSFKCNTPVSSFTFTCIVLTGFLD